MKKRIFGVLLLLVILLSACGQVDSTVPVTPSLQGMIEEVQPSTSEEKTDSETEQASENSTPEQPANQESEPETEGSTQEAATEQESEVAVSPSAEPEPEVLSAAETETEEPGTEETEHPQESSSLLPILMYHHVVPEGTACNSMTVTTSKLAADLTWLAEHGYTTIFPNDLTSGAPLPEKAVMITFDDGYRSNYDLAYPLLQQYQAKAVISIMVFMQDAGVTSFLSWNMCQEMVNSGLVEIGSHAYRLHNLDERNGNFTPGGINGIQRKPDESDEDFQLRVLDDIQKSHDLIVENLGRDVTFFAYPFGIREPDAQELIDTLFPVTVVTATGSADIANGVRNMTRWTVTMNTQLSSILKA